MGREPLPGAPHDIRQYILGAKKHRTSTAVGTRIPPPSAWVDSTLWWSGPSLWVELGAGVGMSVDRDHEFHDDTRSRTGAWPEARSASSTSASGAAACAVSPTRTRGRASGWASGVP